MIISDAPWPDSVSGIVSTTAPVSTTGYVPRNVFSVAVEQAMWGEILHQRQRLNRIDYWDHDESDDWRHIFRGGGG